MKEKEKREQKTKREILKDIFIDTLNGLEHQSEIDNLCHNAFATILPSDYVTGYDNNVLYSKTIKLLQFLVKDKSDVLSYFIYDLEYGKRWKEDCFTENGIEYPLRNASELFDFLTK